MKRVFTSQWNRALLQKAGADALRKLHPKTLWRNPVIFATALCACAVSLDWLRNVLGGHADFFSLQIAAWLWFTVLFANYAEALAEGRGRAQADALRRSRTRTFARKISGDQEEKIAATDLRKGDLCVCEAGDIIPADGEVVEGVASVDESAITGESAPVIRESGGDRSAVTGGTRVLSDCITVRVTAEPGSGFVDRMVGLIEGAVRQRTPNEIALDVLLVSLTVIFFAVVVTLPAFAHFSELQAKQEGSAGFTVTVLAALFVCLIPTTIGGLLSAIGISGINRLVQNNVIATSGRAVEAAGDIDVLLLDKTGTVTFGNRQAAEFIPAPAVSEERLAEAAQLASMADETPEGRSIVVLAKERFALRKFEHAGENAKFVPFTARLRMSGVDLPATAQSPACAIRKGAADSIRRWVESQGGNFPLAVEESVRRISSAGGTPLVVAADGDVLGVVYLKDVVKGGIRERFAKLRRMGIRTVMVTGDNPLTAAAIAAEAGVDDYLAEATPEMKLARIREEQAEGHLVAMAGDGTNDAPALAQADVGVAMNTGTQTAREAGNMLDLDSNPTKLIEIVEIGKQLLITRGALTTFSVANDIAKYFAIFPAVFMTLYAVGAAAGPLSALNVMRLASPQSAILSAVIFNALVIIALIPLALRGVASRTEGAGALLKRNLAVYGVGGMVLPFAGIKLIDLLITHIGLV